MVRKKRDVIGSTNKESSRKKFWQKYAESYWMVTLCEGSPGQLDPKMTFLLAKHLLFSSLHQLLEHTP